MKRNKLTVLLIITIAIVIIAGISGTYAFFQQKEVGKEKVELTGGDISLDFVNDNNYISVTNAYPVSTSKGLIYPYYTDFTLNASVATYPIQYEIQIVPDNNNTISTDYIKVYLTDFNDNQVLGITPYNSLTSATYNTGGKVVYSEKITSSTTKYLRLRIWIDESYTESATETFGFNIYLYAVNTDPVS